MSGRGSSACSPMLPFLRVGWAFPPLSRSVGRDRVFSCPTGRASRVKAQVWESHHPPHLSPDSDHSTSEMCSCEPHSLTSLGNIGHISDVLGFGEELWRCVARAGADQASVHVKVWRGSTLCPANVHRVPLGCEMLAALGDIAVSEKLLFGSCHWSGRRIKRWLIFRG